MKLMMSLFCGVFWLMSSLPAFAQNVGIGTNSPTQKLDVNGQLRVRTLTSGGNSDPMVVVDANGTFKQVALSPSLTENHRSPNTNGGSGNIPGNASTFFVSDGNWTSSLVLPTVADARAAGWNFGEIMVIHRYSTFNVSVATTNTNLGAALAIPGGTSVGFALGRNVWYRVF
ncbi:hypothetical protein [Aureispira anguillae]|uniref:Uncharacterized protein n=1 Tax=Aureispira anguillae TaxID=2864201 RepID=A0A916DVM3_9BACT|nr:hypothetical protein [Aureispira anguillae]BDS15294.1 hypothetical protein AsAng_0060780 [Aureispira anguillae]